MLGLGTLAALCLWSLAGFAARQLEAPRPWLFGVAVASLAGVLGSATYARNFVYGDDLALWLDATRKAPGNPRAWLNAGHAAMARRDDATARSMLLEAHRLSPCYAYIQMNLSALEALEGKLSESLTWADEAVRCNPGLSLARQYRAAALERLGRIDESLEEYRNATEIDGMFTDAWLGQGRLLEQRGAWAAAATAYDGAFAANPSSVEAAMMAGLLYHHRLGDSGRAVERYRAVLDANPMHYGAHYQIAVALLALGKVDEAVTAWRAFVPMAEAVGDRASIEGGPAALREAVR
jgi:tetratricopeptide (TPR) repeat protein